MFPSSQVCRGTVCWEKSSSTDNDELINNKFLNNMSAEIPTSTGTLTRMFAQQNLHDIPVHKLNELSARERSEGFYDIHGVSDALVDETPEFLGQKLQELDATICMPMDQREALDIAIQRSANYVESLRLRFLRAENFDVVRAVTRMALHFNLRRRYFGDQTLDRDLRLSDLSEFDRRLMETGFFQLSNRRDRGGRIIVTQIMKKLGREPPPDSAVSCYLEFGIPSTFSVGRYLTSVVGPPGPDILLVDKYCLE